MKSKYKFKRSESSFGLMVVILGVLLLLGGLFFNTGNNGQNSNYSHNNDNVINNNGNNSYLLDLEDIIIGRQYKQIETHTNLLIGVKSHYRTIFTGNNFILYSSPFSHNVHSILVNFDNPDVLEKALIYFNKEVFRGDDPLVISVGNQKIETDGDSEDIPIILNKNLINKSNNFSTQINFEIKNVPLYNIFSWNKYKIKNLNVVEKIRENYNNNRQFQFNVKNYDILKNIYLNVVTKCSTYEDVPPPILVKVNGQTVEDYNPNCKYQLNNKVIQIPKDIVKDGINNLSFSTKGFYTLTFSVNKVYYNGNDTYTFRITNLDNVYYVVLFGDFDTPTIDLQINGKVIELNRKQIKSITNYIKFGMNQLTILTKPVDIRYLRIQAEGFN